MNVTLYEYHLVDVEVSLEKAINDRLVCIYPYYALSRESFAYKYFPADVGDTFAVISQELHDGTEHIIGLIGLPDGLGSQGDKAIKAWVIDNLEQFISADHLEDWL